MFRKFLLLLCVIQTAYPMNSKFDYKKSNVKGRKLSQQKNAPLIPEPKPMPLKDIKTNVDVEAINAMVQDIVAINAVVGVVVRFANQN